MQVRDDVYDPGPFYRAVGEVISRNEDRDLEEWLLALYRLTIHAGGTPLTEQAFFALLDAAFTEAPATFEENWLTITEAPDDLWIDRKFDAVQPHPADGNGYEYTLDVLRFQIAELHRMRGKQLANDQRYFGIDSDTGNRWYNFDPRSILECGSAGLGVSDDMPDMNWGLLGDLLEMGRVYEQRPHEVMGTSVGRCCVCW